MTELFAKLALLPQGWAEDVTVTVAEDGRITLVETGTDGPTDTRVEILLPAPGNLHSHAFQRAMAGLTERRSAEGQDSFWTWRQQMFQFLTHLDPDDVEAIAAQVQMEMLEAGYAAVAEFHYLHHDPGGAPYQNPAEMAARICAAANTTGIGLTLLPVLYQQGGADGRPLGPGQIRFGSAPDQFQLLCDSTADAITSLPADTRLGTAAHSLRAVTPDALRSLVPSTQGPFHMHIAEQVAEVEETRAILGARPVTWLLDNLDVDPRWCLIHCTQMTPDETRALAATGAVAGLCPITEASLGDGIFDGARWLQGDGRLGIGSDSNIRISLAEELRQLEYSQRLRDRSRAVLARPGQSTARQLLDAALTGGVQALGRPSGGIETGRLADLVALDGAATDLIGRRQDAILDTWVFTSGDALVRDVWAAGRHVVRDGQHIARAEIATRYRACMTRLAALI